LRGGRLTGRAFRVVEKGFFETIGESGACGLEELFARNDEAETVIVHNGQRHYRKYLATGRYLTLLGEITVRRGICQSNKEKRSICPLELRLKFINDFVSFAAVEYICYSLASMTLGEFIKHCRKWTLMKPSEGAVRRALDYVGNFLQSNDFLQMSYVGEGVSKEAVTLAMSRDSTCILIKGEGWRHASAATVSAYDAQGVRLDTVYIGSVCPRQERLR